MPTVHPPTTSEPASALLKPLAHGPCQATTVVVVEEDRPVAEGCDRTLTFIVTGAASIARLEPLLVQGDWESRRRIKWSRASAGDAGCAGARIDFVWETTVSKRQHREHRNARVLNRLSGAQVCGCFGKEQRQ